MAIRTSRQFLFSSRHGTVRANQPARADIPHDQLVYKIRLAILEKRWPTRKARKWIDYNRVKF